MKKIMVMLLFCVLILTGCDPATYYFVKTSYLDQIESIELVRYNNSNFEMVDSTKVNLKFDYEKVDRLEILTPNKINSFLKKYSDNDFLQRLNYCVKDAKQQFKTRGKGHSGIIGGNF